MTPIGQTNAIQSALAHATTHGPAKHEAHLRDVAMKLEATFLAEMLKHAGVGENRTDFGGGVGEDQFASFLRQEQAQRLSESGGIGLAEHLFRAMGGTQNDAV